jgi:hypothetical protein
MSTALSIIDALDDPALYAPWFPGQTWDGWRAVLKGIYGLPMSDDEATFFRSISGRDPPQRPAKEVWIVVGRRGGKDSVASVIAAHAAALFQDDGHLRPGERAVVMCLAVDRDQAKVVLNYTRSYFADIDLLKGMIQRETDTGFELTNSVDIAVSTNSYRSVRGRPILCAIFDEVSFWRDESSATPDDETYKAIKPALASLPGSIVIGISSPYRKSGLLYKKFKKHYGQDGDVLVIKAPTRLLNPTIPQEVIDEALAEDPAAARAEWMAEFRDDVDGWATAELIESAIDRNVTVRPPKAGVSYFAFSDPSGGARDSFTTAIAHNENDAAVLDCIIEIKAPFNPTSATQQVCEMLKTYGLSKTTGDKYAAAWVVDAFAKNGVDYEHSERDRSAIYLDVLPLFTSGRAHLLDNKRLASQFMSLERRTSSIGKDKVDHGPGGHDDLCNSAAGAMVLAAGGRRLLIITPEVAAEYARLSARSPRSASASIFQNR